MRVSSGSKFFVVHVYVNNITLRHNRIIHTNEWVVLFA